MKPSEELVRRNSEKGATNSAESDMHTLLARIPYARFLGVDAECRGNEITTLLPFADHLVGNPRLPAIHGGVIGGLLEITCVIQLLFDTGYERFPKTIDISIDYLRTGKPMYTYGRATVTRHGRRVANVRAEIWQEDRARPIAAARGHFLLQPISNPG